MLVFCSEFGASALEQAEIIGVDGTFKTCPPPFYQLFIIQVFNEVLCIWNRMFPGSLPASGNLKFKAVSGSGMNHSGSINTDVIS